MHVGSIPVDPPVILAPMAAVTDLPFRTVAEEHGVGLTITEFLSAHALAIGDPKATGKLTASLDGRRFGVQIFGREEEMLARGAEIALAIGASLVDINMGCPAKRVVAGECGSALMREPLIAQSLVRAVRGALPPHVPVTVKHRAGWDHGHKNAPEFACAMVEAGARMITVHGRTRTQGFAGQADLEIIRLVREAVPAHIPVVGNGDVVDVAGYVRMRETTGCDAVMIGRGAQGNPWLFSRIGLVAAGRPDPGPPTLEERRDVFRRHVALIGQLKRGPRVLHEVRKACAWYARGLYGCNKLRIEVWSAPDVDLAVACAEAYFTHLIDRRTSLGLAPEADRTEMNGAAVDEAACVYPRKSDPRAYLVAESAAMQAVVAAIESHASCDAPVLITGERGTGRELVARLLHLSSRRRQGKFVTVRPTFDAGESGADDDELRAKRALRAAQGGTLLVKDVCDVPAIGQRTLRRAMRGDAAVKKPDTSGETYDVRLVGSAGLELERAVTARILSRELYEPLALRRIDVPALRHRGGDIPTLVERWVRHYADEVGRGKLSVSTRAHERLVKYPWPGNVAELKDLVRRLVIGTEGARIEAGNVDAVLPRVAERVPLEELSFEDMVKSKLAGFLDRMDGYEVHDLYEKVIERVERPLFELVMTRTGGNQVKAAAILGLNRNTLRKKLESQGVSARGKKGRQDRALDD